MNPQDFNLSDINTVSVTPQLLKECSELFNENYGIWSDKGPHPGKNVKLSTNRLKEQCLFDENTCRLAIIRYGGKLVAHAFYTKFMYASEGRYSVWITQLVVHKDYRSNHLARKLIESCCSYLLVVLQHHIHMLCLQLNQLWINN